MPVASCPATTARVTRNERGIVLALGFAGSKVLGVQPPLSFETTVVLMVLGFEYKWGEV